MKDRDLQADYKAAMIEEYQGYARAGMEEEAEHVALTLKHMFDYDVAPKAKADKPAEPPVERAVPEASEMETPEEPVKRGPGRPRKNP